jgi:hypothetical protein
MQFCKLEDGTAIVEWQWQGDTTSIKFETGITPILVEVTQFSAGAPPNNNCGTLYGVWSMKTSDNVTSGNNFSYNGFEQESPIVNNRSIFANCSGRLIYSDGSTQAGAIQISDLLFTPSNQSGYTIKISDTIGNQLKTDSRLIDSPPRYEVACGQECPDGYMKCPSNQYPGYCCVKCAEIKQGIISAKEAVRRVNNG